MPLDSFLRCRDDAAAVLMVMMMMMEFKIALLLGPPPPGAPACHRVEGTRTASRRGRFDEDLVAEETRAHFSVRAARALC